MESHSMGMLALMVLLVLIGDTILRRNGLPTDDKKYFHYMLLLFKLWQSFGDLR
ncbi:hypothetical protein J3R82DRAFT_1765 [Butyriboletus roseoflavus]|nr:hypothetical protein J3R82DRAFT_1765 [Butyriboletus roseoflavus]